MIQFKRGKSNSWRNQKTPLADGQPGYDKDRNKLKIGNGKDSWENLPDVSGLRMDEILVSEKDAKDRNNGSLSLLALIKEVLKRSGRPIFTYGTEAPDKDTLGQVYLQHYETEPEMDYVVETGINRGWHYQKWHSGWAQCQGTFTLEMPVNSAFEQTSLFCSGSSSFNKYPFTFKYIPNEVASLKGNGNIVWLAGKDTNSKEKPGSYVLISPDSKSKSKYLVSFEVSGWWR